MSLLTRRRALHGFVGVLAFVAGCSGEDIGTGPSDRATTPNPNAETVTDPDSATLRVSGERSAVWREEEATDDSRGRDRISREFLTDVRTAESLSFATDGDGTGAEEVRSFLDSTDYAAETVYVEQVAVGDCFRRELCSVRWTDTEIETSYARRFRDADVACETGAKDTVAWFVRIPDTVDPDAIRGRGSRYGSDGCRPPDGRRADGSGAGSSRGPSGTATADGGTGRDDAAMGVDR